MPLYNFSILSINDYFLIALIGAVLFYDLTRNKIPNFLTFPAIIWGVISYAAMQGLEGLWFSLLGLLVGLAIFFIPFAMGGMGAGDVKLMGAIGALQGWQFVLSVALITAVAGGVMAVVYLLVNGRLLRVLKRMAGFMLAPFFSALYYRIRLELFNRASIFFARHEPEEQEPARMPYGAAIAVGVLVFLALNLFPWGEPFLNALPW